MEEKIKQFMKVFNVTREEAIEMIECDKAIDRGERVYFDLPKEQEKEAKKWAPYLDAEQPCCLSTL